MTNPPLNADRIYRSGPTTARLMHRAFEPADARAFFALNSNEDVMRFTGEAPLPSEEVALTAIESYVDFERYGYGRWACVYHGRVIGFSGMKYLPEHEVVDLGYRFLPEYWGQGFATESARACVDFAFTTMGVHELWAFVLPKNKASIRVLEKLDFERDDRIKDAEYPEALSYIVRAKTQD